MITNTQPTLFDAETGNSAKQLLGDVPFTDADGKSIFVGDIIEQTNFNGEQYLARYEVVIDPADNEVCLLMISGKKNLKKDLSAAWILRRTLFQNPKILRMRHLFSSTKIQTMSC